MCRFTLYSGPPILIGSLVTEPENSLIHQSFDNKERKEHLNGDGFGLAWYPPNTAVRPACFRSITPAWNNRNLQELARVVESRIVLAHVRAASEAFSVSEANCHPFAYGAFAFMHNGEVGGFSKLRRALVSQLSDRSFELIRGNTDSEHAFAVLLDELDKFGPEASLEQVVSAVRETIVRLVELVEIHAPGEDSYLNFAFSNGRCAVVTRFTTQTDFDGESLYLHRGRRYTCKDGMCMMVDPDEAGGAVLVSSEMLSSDPGWERIPRNHVVSISANQEVKLERI